MKKNSLEKRIEKLQEQTDRGRKFLEETKYLVEIETEGSPLNGEDKMVEMFFHTLNRVVSLRT